LTFESDLEAVPYAVKIYANLRALFVSFCARPADLPEQITIMSRPLKDPHEAKCDGGPMQREVRKPLPCKSVGS
jgi:hypothetical protein